MALLRRISWEFFWNKSRSIPSLIPTLIRESKHSPGHSVVTTVRSQSKIDKIRRAFSKYSKDQLDFVIVEELAQPGAFDQAVISTPLFELVIYIASSCLLSVKDIQKELINPAVMGTTETLEAVQANAPSVTRVVITSSSVSVFDLSKGTWPGHVYNEKEWNPITPGEALSDPSSGYFVKHSLRKQPGNTWKSKLDFILVTILPTLIFGPIIPGIHSLSGLNTSNQLIYGFTQGMPKETFPEFAGHVWVGVRDVAAVNVKAATSPDASGNRFIACGSPTYNYKLITNIIKKSFPEYLSVLPSDNVEGGDFPTDKGFSVNTSLTEEVLGIKFMTLEMSITDTVKSFQAAEKI
ncbi:hypothetical protein ACMFMF_006560 [Clarireedia jacksonii]